MTVGRIGSISLDGAVKADHQPGPERHRVLFDPAGHPFCLSSLIPD